MTSWKVSMGAYRHLIQRRLTAVQSLWVEMRQSAFKLCPIFFLIGISAVVRVALPLLLQSFETRQDEALSVKIKELGALFDARGRHLKCQCEDGTICASQSLKPFPTLNPKEGYLEAASVSTAARPSLERLSLSEAGYPCPATSTKSDIGSRSKIHRKLSSWMWMGCFILSGLLWLIIVCARASITCCTLLYPICFACFASSASIEVATSNSRRFSVHDGRLLRCRKF